MKIQIYDKFDSFEHFTNVIKGVFNRLEDNGAKVSTMVAYVTLVDDENKKFEFKNECGEVLGIEIGKFPWIDKGEGHENWWYFGFIQESEMFSQNDYKLLCLRGDNDEKLKPYLPITRHSKCGNKRVFDTIDELQKNHYSSYYLLQAIKDGTPYRDFTWTSDNESR